MRLSAPPLLKTTIIQLNKDIDPEDNNYEILTNGYNDTLRSVASAPFSIDEAPRKKRRRSSSFIDDEELAKRRTETKQLHSIIEKRRRVKINREFEALKYLIPACRSTDPAAKRLLGANSSSKIDGMYKLTILKAAVEYMLYLHHVVKEQHDALEKVLDTYSYDVGFCDVNLDVNQYRNIDQDFDFSELTADMPIFSSVSQKSHCGLISEGPEGDDKPRSVRAKSDTSALITGSSILPTPDVTPDIVPTFTHQTEQDIQRVHATLMSRPFLFESRGRESVSTNTSPFTAPVKSQMKATFHLPDPALGANSTSTQAVGPRKMFFRTKPPTPNEIPSLRGDAPRNSIDGQINSAVSETRVRDTTGENKCCESMEGTRLEDATRALLNLRTPSIDNLLN